MRTLAAIVLATQRPTAAQSCPPRRKGPRFGGIRSIVPADDREQAAGVVGSGVCTVTRLQLQERGETDTLTRTPGAQYPPRPCAPSCPFFLVPWQFCPDCPPEADLQEASKPAQHASTASALEKEQLMTQVPGHTLTHQALAPQPEMETQYLHRAHTA